MVRDLMDKGAFHSMYAVAAYTFAPYKVMWPEVGHTVRAGATIVQRDPVLGIKSLIPHHTLIMIPTPTPEEAHYLAALLNSAPATLVVQGYVSLHPSPHVLEHVAIPKFDPANPLHQSLASLSQQAHQLVAKGKTQMGFSSLPRQTYCIVWEVAESGRRVSTWNYAGWNSPHGSPAVCI